jgi:hypothetical protein
MTKEEKRSLGSKIKGKMQWQCSSCGLWFPLPHYLHQCFDQGHGKTRGRYDRPEV